MRQSAIKLLLILVLIPAICLGAGKNPDKAADPKNKRAYFGLGFQYLQTSLNNLAVTGGFSDAATDQLELRLGYFITPRIALEGRFGSSVDRYYLTNHSSPDSYEIENYASAYLRLQTPDFGRYHLFAIAGYSVAAAASSSGETDESGASWGIGLGMTLEPGNSLGIEYTSVVNNDSLQAEAWGIVFNHRF